MSKEFTVKHNSTSRPRPVPRQEYHYHVRVFKPGEAAPYADNTHPTGTHADQGVSFWKSHGMDGDRIVREKCNQPLCKVEVYPPQKAATLEVQPEAVARMTAHAWEIIAGDKVISSDSEHDTAWFKAAVLLKAPGYSGAAYQGLRECSRADE